MNARNWSILGLAMVLAFTLTVGLPGGAQAQQNHPAANYSPQDNAGGYYGNGGYAYCPMGPGYGYSAPANQNYQHYASRTWNKDYRGAWCSWNSGYPRGYRNDGSYCW